MDCDVSIVIPVLDRIAFTRQCLDRIWRNTGDQLAYEIVVVDNGSTDTTAEWFADSSRFPTRVLYHRNSSNVGFAAGNNIGARLSQGRRLLFLNNDTLVQPGWLEQMVRILDADSKVGIVGIKQLFPYTNRIYHTGIVFDPAGKPEHLYPHLETSLERVNKQREYQAVMGACLLIDRSLFEECGGFDEGYRNGYEDVDLCLTVRQRGRKIVCCTSAFIYHYGQISEGRTADDGPNAARFASRWAGIVKSDRDDYLVRDSAERLHETRPTPSGRRSLPDDCIYLADALDDGSALTWINAELALALHARGLPVVLNGQSPLSPSLDGSARRRLASLAIKHPAVGGVQIKWSHYRPRHLALDLAGTLNLEFFVINYLFSAPNADPWDFWLQCVRQNGYEKLPLSEFCDGVLEQLGVASDRRHLWHPGYSTEIASVEPPARRDGRFRFLTVTNSHDLERYNTAAVLDAYSDAFSAGDDVVLVIKDYGASSGDRTIRDALRERSRGPAVEYRAEFSDKRALIELYKSSDAFVSAHRGEGFGMKILDAMACGLPVVTPLFGGPTAYCEPGNCFPVAFSLAPMGECLDSRSLRITNGPTWAEVDTASLRDQLRRVRGDRALATEVGRRAHSFVVDRFSWDSAASRIVQLSSALREERRVSGATVKAVRPVAASVESPYWLGLRMSVVVPTHNRKDKLSACLDALERQTVLPQEFEVIVVDDGSTDGTREALASRRFPFAIRYIRQEASGPAAARNLGIAESSGEHVLLIGDDILADERLIEEHLLGHAANPDPDTAILGHIEWPVSMKPNAVMEYVCGDAKLQFAYSYISQAPVLDHRFFYTSNISLKRRFLQEAADAGVRFDSAFRLAAFEDSEFAFRLLPRGLRIRYSSTARAGHDHWMDLDSFAAREFNAGAMAVVFYRKHPSLDDYLKVRWISDLIEPASSVVAQPALLSHLEAFDTQTDALLRALARSLEELLAMDRPAGDSASISLSHNRLRAAVHNVLEVIFDVERTRGKLEEWFSSVEDPAKARAAKTLASVMRKIEFLNLTAEGIGPLRSVAPIDSGAVATLSQQIAGIDGMPALTRMGVAGSPQHRIRRRVRRVLGAPFIFSRLLKADRFIEARLQPNHAAWLTNYRRFRGRIRALVG